MPGYPRMEQRSEYSSSWTPPFSPELLRRRIATALLGLLGGSPVLEAHAHLSISSAQWLYEVCIISPSAWHPIVPTGALLPCFGAGKKTTRVGDCGKAPLIPCHGEHVDWWPLLLFLWIPRWVCVTLPVNCSWPMTEWGYPQRHNLRDPGPFQQAILLWGVPVSLAKPFLELHCCLRLF